MGARPVHILQYVYSSTYTKDAGSLPQIAFCPSHERIALGHIGGSERGVPQRRRHRKPHQHSLGIAHLTVMSSVETSSSGRGHLRIAQRNLLAHAQQVAFIFEKSRRGCTAFSAKRES